MITKQESDALNLIRWLSTIAIVACHFLQGYGSAWAWVLNLGVQVFFFLSGFLYGEKRIAHVGKFYWGRILKVYLPFALWVVVAAALLFFFAPEHITIKGLARQLLLRGNLPGLNHMWFLYVIMICYLWLPLVDWVVSKRAMLGISFFAVVMGLLLALRYNVYYLWIALYFVGYICGRYSSVQKYALAVSTAVTLWILVDAGFGLDIFRQESIANNLLHACAGIMIFLALYLGVRKVKMHDKFSHLLTNGGGYEVYLTHHIFILGPLSLLYLTENRLVNMAIITALIFICSYGLMKSSAWINKKLKR